MKVISNGCMVGVSIGGEKKNNVNNLDCVHIIFLILLFLPSQLVHKIVSVGMTIEIKKIM